MAKRKERDSPEKRSPKKGRPDPLGDNIDEEMGDNIDEEMIIPKLDEEMIIPKLVEGVIEYEMMSDDAYVKMKHEHKIAGFVNHQSGVFTIAYPMRERYISIITFMNPNSIDGEVITRLYQDRNGHTLEMISRKCYSGLDNFDDNQPVVDKVISKFRKYSKRMKPDGEHDGDDQELFDKMIYWVERTFGEDPESDDGDPSHDYNDRNINDRSVITLQQHSGTDGANGKKERKKKHQTEKKPTKSKIQWKDEFEALNKLIGSLTLGDAEKEALTHLSNSLQRFREQDISNRSVSMGPKATLSFPELAAAVGLLSSIVPCAQELSHLLNKVLNTVMSQLKKMLESDPTKIKDWDVKQLASILVGQLNADNVDHIIEQLKPVITKMTPNQKMALLM
jgi:hypothetical protein